MKKIFLRIISTVITGIFLTAQNPILFAEVASAFVDPSPSDSVSNSEILGEVKEKRSEFTKHFRMSDGTMKAITYSDPVHYKDAEEFKEIDNTLIEGENDTYKNADSPFKVNFSKNFKNKGLVTVNSKGHEISFSYIKKKYKEFDTEVLKDAQEKAKVTNSEDISADENTLENPNVSEAKEQNKLEVKKKEVTSAPITRLKTKILSESSVNSIPELESESEALKIENLKDKKIISRNKDEEKISVSKTCSKAKYENSDNDIDLDYMVSGLGLKENIVLRKKLPDNDKFDFELKTELSVIKDSSGNLNFNDSDGKTIFTMTKGNMWDSNKSYSSEIDYEIAPISGGYILSIIPNRDWLESDERVYPIILDPSIKELANESIIDTQCSNLHSDTNYKDSSNLSVGCLSEGDKWNTYIKCQKLPHFSHGEIITQSELKLRPYPGSNTLGSGLDAYSNSPDNCIGIRNVTSSWDDGIRWNTKPSSEEICQDYKTTSSSTINDWNSWNITRSTKQWYTLDNPNDNNGLELYSLDESLSSVIRFVSGENSEYTDYKPKFEISYREFIGEESYWSYKSYSAGYQGSGKVNLYAGTLSVSEDILSYSGSRNPVSIKNTYNNVNYNENANTYFHTKTFAGGYPRSSYTGHGFRLSFNKLVYPLPSDDNLYSEGWRYVYIDGDGTQHYFKLDEGKIIDCDGLNLTLEEFEEEKEGKKEKKIHIKDLGENKITFYKPDSSDAAYVLESTSDNNGNITTYNYSDDHKLTSITDAAGRITEIKYIDGTRTVSKIVASDKKEVEFYYTGNKLTKVVYPEGMKTEYAYDLHGRLSVVSTNEGGGRSVKYEYASNDKDSSNFFKVRSMAIYGSQKIDPKAKGKSLEFWYDMNQTKITNKINNLDVPYHESSEIWQFDDEGRATNVMDENGNFYETEYFKKSEETLKTKHRIKETSDGQKIVHNLLKNSRADDTSLSNWNVENWNPDHVSSANCCKIETSNEQANLGKNSFKVSMIDNHTSWLVAKQIVSVPLSRYDKKYTFSADVKINEDLKGGDGASLHIGAFKDNVQTSGDEYSQWIHSTNGDWRRLHVTINVPAGSNHVRCYFGIKNSFGDAYFDCLQLEEGNTANEYNMIECSDFKENSNVWISSELDSSKDKITENGMRITGNINQPKNISQKIFINKENPTFNVAIKAQAKSLPKTGSAPSVLENPGFFALLEIKYSNEEVTKKVDGYFNQSVYDDQYYFNSISAQDYLSSNLTPTAKTVEYIQLYICYNFNCNDVYIKEAQITVADGLNAYLYNANGSTIGTKDKLGNSTKTEYTNKEEVKKVTRNVSKTETEFVENTFDNKDEGHNLESQVCEFADNKKSKSKFTYDSVGNVLTSDLGSADSEGKKIHSENTYQSKKNYLQTSKDSRDKVVTYEYDEDNGNLKSVKNANNTSVNYSYDSADRLTGETCEGSQNEYSYIDGIITEVSHKVDDIRKTTYKFLRNIFGNIIETQLGNKTLSKSTYDAGGGLLRQVRYGNGQTVNYDYDEKGRLIKKSFGYGYGNKFGEVTYTYDNKNRINQTYDSLNNLTTNFEFDRFGRFARMYRSDGQYSSEVNYDNFRNVVNKSVLNLFGITQTLESDFGKSDLILNSKVQTGNSSVLSKYNFDEIARLDSIEALTNDSTAGIRHKILYEDYGDSRTTGLVSALEIYKKVSGQWTSLVEKFKYTYDDVGNITDIKDINDNLIAHYEYDKLNRLKRENNSQLNKTIDYSYNEGGNLTKKDIYSYTTDLNPTEPEITINYSYEDANWPDKLTSFNGQNIIYDAIGNPLDYKGWELEWSRGRKLEKMSNSGYNISFKYDENGIRTQKTVNGVSTDFITSGIRVLAQKTGDNLIIWQTDSCGNTIGFTYNNVQYLYLKNSQGDIIGITDASGNIIAKYTYDSWGKLISITDETGADKTSDTEFIGYINPLRYREYYYDNETGLYYLNARYYDPEVCRFLNADENLDNEANAFIYCENNPILFADSNGLETRLDKHIEKNYKNQMTVALIVDTPSATSRSVFKPFFKVGHTFIRVDNGNGGVTYTGLYPAKKYHIPQLIKRDAGHNKKNTDDTHKWTYAKVYPINDNQLTALNDFINNYKTSYHLIKNNCTDFALQTLNHIGIETGVSQHYWSFGFVGKWISKLLGLFGHTPADAGQDILGSDTIKYSELLD